jgi:hypothetical protein
MGWMRLWIFSEVPANCWFTGRMALFFFLDGEEGAWCPFFSLLLNDVKLVAYVTGVVGCFPKKKGINWFLFLCEAKFSNCIEI